MEQQQNSLFGLGIDESIKQHLWDAAKWGRFLAIIGFIMCGLTVAVGVYYLVNAEAMGNEYTRYGAARSMEVMGPVMFAICLIAAVICFFPALFLLRFSNQMKSALETGDQPTLTTSFQNLKVTFRYIGVVTIIYLAFVVLGLLAGLGGNN